MDKVTDYDLDKVINSWEFENHPEHIIRKIAVELKQLRAENARLREQNDIAVHFVRWVIQWESDPDVKSLARYMIDNAKLTLKEINKSTPPSQAENVSKNSEDRGG